MSLDVGSKTLKAGTTPGVEKHSLTTRPINLLLTKIKEKEQSLIKNKITPHVVVCGAGAAGIELAFGFK